MKTRILLAGLIAACFSVNTLAANNNTMIAANEGAAEFVVAETESTGLPGADPDLDLRKRQALKAYLGLVELQRMAIDHVSALVARAEMLDKLQDMAEDRKDHAEDAKEKLSKDYVLSACETYEDVCSGLESRYSSLIKASDAHKATYDQQKKKLDVQLKAANERKEAIEERLDSAESGFDDLFKEKS